jgi:hypothetical protein
MLTHTGVGGGRGSPLPLSISIGRFGELARIHGGAPLTVACRETGVGAVDTLPCGVDMELARMGATARSGGCDKEG